MYGSALETTACLARTTFPLANFTPTARSFSTMISSTWQLRQTSPPYFFTPLTSASAIEPLPPLGKSSVTPGRYQSASIYAMTAFMVPAAGRPCSRKHNISSQFLTNLFSIFISSIMFAKGSFSACPCCRVANSSLGYLSRVKIAPGSSRNAMEVKAWAAFERGVILSINAANSSSAPGPPCCFKTSPNSSGPIFAANFSPLGRTVPHRSYVIHSQSSSII
mmetsp:Transcript_95444/g.267327  ORF Transcript_95444/g.267327 Transcript_95444/m.267327 type:complete len:221 (+) Transcript_95444:539-1201(+)